MSLSTVTANFSGKYETLFTPLGVFLECQEKEKEDQWTLLKNNKGDKAKYFERIAVMITRSTNVSLVQNLEGLVLRVNTLWTPFELKVRGINPRALDCKPENE